MFGFFARSFGDPYSSEELSDVKNLNKKNMTSLSIKTWLNMMKI